MTQNTQTTTERIENQLNDIHDTYPGSVYDCFRVIAKEIAAEIDALTRERDEARAQLDNAAREMGESMIASARLRAEVERLRIPALALELLKGEGWTVADYVAKAEEAARAAKESQP